MVKWRAALSQLSSQGAAGLSAFQGMLQQAASGSAESAADSLDVVFDVADLGQQLLSYVDATQVTSKTCHNMQATAVHGEVQCLNSRAQSAVLRDMRSGSSFTAARAATCPIPMCIVSYKLNTLSCAAFPLAYACTGRWTVCLPKQWMLQAPADVTALPPSAKRGLSLMAEQKWVDAMKVFSALQQQQSDSSSSSSPTTNSSDIRINQSLLAICQAQLGLPVTALPIDKPSATFKIPMCPGKLPPPPPPPPAATAAAAQGKLTKHPLQHLAAALKHSQQAANVRAVSSKPARGITAAGFRAQQKADAQAAGESLAFLLHPAVFKTGSTSTSSTSNDGSSPAAGLPASLVDLALQLLTVQGKAAFSVSSTGLSSALGAAGAAPTAAAGVGLGGWEQRAGDSKSKALQGLVKLTGLDPVKKEMFNLADQVRRYALWREISRTAAAAIVTCVQQPRRS